MGRSSEGTVQLYSFQELLGTEDQRVVTALCAAPGLSVEEVAAQTGVSAPRVKQIIAGHGLTTLKSRIARGGGLVTADKNGHTNDERSGVFPLFPGQIVEIDTATLGVMVRNGAGCKLTVTVACDALTRTVAVVAGSDLAAHLRALQMLEEKVGRAQRILCDHRADIAGQMSAATGIEVMEVELFSKGEVFTTHRVERANGWIKRRLMKIDCRLLRSPEAVFDAVQAVVEDYDVRFGDLPPRDLRNILTKDFADAALTPDVAVWIAAKRGYRNPTIRSINAEGVESDDNRFAYLIVETPPLQKSSRLARFAASRKPGFYWSSIDARDEV